MLCHICQSDDWKNVDEYRDKPQIDGKPVGMSLCQTCGFISYPSKYKTKAEIYEYYRKEYRGGAPHFGNLTTGERKLHYHAHFLQGVFNGWEKDGNKKPKIGEVGAAIGMVGNWFKQGFPDCEYHGTELTETFRKVAFHEFGIRLQDELPQDPDSYDLLVSYKVHEHLFDPFEELQMYHKLLRKDGFLYISVPTWFGRLENFGMSGFDLGYYYHPDHVNVWTKKLFESLLKKAGFKIFKYNNEIYGDTYLCKKCDPQELTDADFEKPDEIIEHLKTIKEVSEHCKVGRFDEAVKLWGNFPIAWMNAYDLARADLDREFEGNGLQIANAFKEKAEKGCGKNVDIDRLYAEILMRYGHYQKAAEVLQDCLERRPNQANMLMPLSHCFRELSYRVSDPNEKLKLRATARDICRRVIQVDKQAQTEAWNWALKDSSEIDIDEFVKFYKNEVNKNKAQQQATP